jgi:hypothetical protein
VITGAFGAVPLFATILPDKQSFYFFPPFDPVFRIGTIILCVLVTITIYFISDLAFVKSAKRRVTALLVVFGVSVVGLLLFLASYYRFVRTIDIPTKETSVSVAVGFTRTAFSDREFPGVNDWEVLRRRGTGEEEIQTVWTRSSIILARLMLFGAYLLCLLSAVGVGSLAVLYQGLGQPSKP